MGRGFGTNRRGSKPSNLHGHHAHNGKYKYSQTRSNADMPSYLERFRYPHSDDDVSGGGTSRGFYMNQSLSIHDRLNTGVSGNYGHSYYGHGRGGQVHLSNLARTYGHSTPSSRFGSPSKVRARRFLNVMDIAETPIVKKDASMVAHTGIPNNNVCEGDALSSRPFEDKISSAKGGDCSPIWSNDSVMGMKSENRSIPSPITITENRRLSTPELHDGIFPIKGMSVGAEGFKLLGYSI
uniref:Uncharacterized protein n=1 Tax=Megaselia scalaris TaxID=36166 RepID=T1GB86_MEGSC